MFRSGRPEGQAAEVHAAYRARIDAMVTYGSDSPEGLVAEVKADDMAAAFRRQTGQNWHDLA
jgi:hypothetical protein